MLCYRQILKHLTILLACSVKEAWISCYADSVLQITGRDLIATLTEVEF